GDADIYTQAKATLSFADEPAYTAWNIARSDAGFTDYLSRLSVTLLHFFPNPEPMQQSSNRNASTHRLGNCSCSLAEFTSPKCHGVDT
ncbi:MAG: hypothetical protein ACPHJ3_10220, partial [Rubripirellula sp.]